MDNDSLAFLSREMLRDRLERSRRLRRLVPADWDLFVRHWLAFNAMYASFRVGGELDAIEQFLAARLSMTDAAGVVDRVVQAVAPLIDEPPGDMRKYGRADFKARSSRFARLVRDPSAPREWALFRTPRARLPGAMQPPTRR